MEKPKWVVLYNLTTTRARVFFNNEYDAELLFNRLHDMDNLLLSLTHDDIYQKYQFVPTKRPFDKSDWPFL